jgi:hypothetical protein
MCRGDSEHLHIAVAVTNMASYLAMSVPRDETVIGLKGKIRIRIPVEPPEQRIVFRGSVLDDDQSFLHSHGVRSGCRLHMVPHPSSTLRCRSTCDLCLLARPPAPRPGSFSVSDIHYERSLQGLRAEGTSLEQLRDVDTAISKAEMTRLGHCALVRSVGPVGDFMNRRFRPPAHREVTVIGPPATRPSVDPLPLKYPFAIPSDDDDAPL